MIATNKHLEHPRTEESMRKQDIYNLNIIRMCMFPLYNPPAYINTCEHRGGLVNPAKDRNQIPFLPFAHLGVLSQR